MPRHLAIEMIGDVAVARILDARLLDVADIEALGDELSAVIDERRHRAVALDLSRLELLPSSIIIKLLGFERRMRRAGGRCALLGVGPRIAEVFEITRTNLLFKIVSTRDEAVEWLSATQPLVLLVLCPVFGCGDHARSSHLLNFIPGLSMTWTENCPGCAAVLKLDGTWPDPGAQTDATVREVELGTYDGERVVLYPSRYVSGPDSFRVGMIEVHGRLDLFASEAVERLWRTLPAPRAAAIDLRNTSEISLRGIAQLADLNASDPANFPAAVVAKDDAAPLIPACFPRVADLNELGRVLSPPPRARGAQALKTTVERGAAK